MTTVSGPMVIMSEWIDARVLFGLAIVPFIGNGKESLKSVVRDSLLALIALALLTL